MTIPSEITCNFSSQGEGRWGSGPSCHNKVATAALMETSFSWKDGVRDEPTVTYHPRCTFHAGVEKRKVYKSGALVYLTTEITNLILAELSRISAAKAASQIIQNEKALIQEQAYLLRKNEESLVTFSAVRNDENGDVNYEASRGLDELVYWPSLPRWIISEEGTSSSLSFASSVKVVNNKVGYPAKLEVRNSSEMTINQAKALVEALQAAILVATEGNAS